MADVMRPYGDGTVNHPPPETIQEFMARVWGKDPASLNEADRGRLAAIGYRGKTQPNMVTGGSLSGGARFR